MQFSNGMKNRRIVFLIVVGLIALATLVYVEQTLAHKTRMQLAVTRFPGVPDVGVGFNPTADLDPTEFSAAAFPVDRANVIPTPSSGAAEVRRGLPNEILLSGTPTAPRARPAPARGLAVPRHASDLTGQMIVPSQPQTDLL